MALPHWKFGETLYVLGLPHDGFCVKRRYHVLVSRDAPAPGWHISVRPFCSEPDEVEPTPIVGRELWLPDVIAFFALVGVKWEEESTSEIGTVHFHERTKKKEAPCS